MLVPLYIKCLHVFRMALARTLARKYRKYIPWCMWSMCYFVKLRCQNKNICHFSDDDNDDDGPYMCFSYPHENSPHTHTHGTYPYITG